MQRHFNKITTIVIIMTMLVTMIPCRYVSAEEYGNESTLLEGQTEAAKAEEWDNGSDAITEESQEIGIEEEPVLEEVDRRDAIDEESTENSTTFDLGGNRKLLVMYGGDVRFRDDNDALVEYDPELVPIKRNGSENGRDLDGYKYENRASDHKQYLPERLTEDTPVVLESEDRAIEMAPALDSATAEVEVEQETEVNAYEEAEEKDLKAVYADESTGNVFTYTSLNEGLKEEITIPEKPVDNTLRFRLKLTGLIPEQTSDGSIVLKDKETGEEKADIEKPSMNDASNDACSDDIRTDIEEDEEPDTYVYTMTVSRKYLNSRDRIYPVTIDPTVTWRSSDYVGDTYIRSKAADTNYFKSSVKVIKVGRSSAGTHRGYIKIYPLRGKVTGKYVTSAKMMVRESSASNANKTVGVYAVKTSWNLPVITWNNRASYYTTALDTKKTNGNTGHTLTFDITSWARDLANGSKLNYGLMLKNTSENDGTFAEFRGTSYGTAAYRPKFVVEYTDGPTKASSVSVKKTYIKPGESAKVSWKGIKSAGLAHIQYRVARYDTSTGKIADKYYVPYTNFSSSYTASSGTDVTIPGSGSFPEGKYRVYIRGIDNGGIVGTGVGANIYVDGTVPTISDFEIDPETAVNDYTGIKSPCLSWNVTEKYLSAVNVYVDGNEAGSLSTASCDGYQLPEGIIRTSGVHQIHITAVDKSGNSASTQDQNYYVDIDPPGVTRFVSQPDTNFRGMSDNRSPVLSWNVTDNDLESVTIYKYDDGELDEVYDADENDMSQGSYTVRNSDLEEGRNVFKLVAEDSGGQSSFRVCTYYLDTEAPYAETVEILPETGFINGSAVLTPEIRWSYIDQAISKVKYSMDGTSYSDMGTSKVGSFTLPEGSFPGGAGIYTIYVKAVDTAGNESSVSAITYHLSGVTESDLIPENIQVTEYYGKNVLTWDADGYCPEMGKIKIYRGSTSDFNISSGILIEENADNGTFTDNCVGTGDSYYRLVVVSEAADHHIICQSSAVHGASMLRVSDMSGKTGSKEYLAYHDFSTPSGEGAVELSSGNLRYTETDYDISNGKQDYGLSRSYNSLDVRTTAFGRGVSDSYHKTVYEDESGNVYYVDGSGTVYRFILSGSSYSLDGIKDFDLTVTDDGYQIEDKEHNVISFDGYGKVMSEEEPNGLDITYVYDALGRLDRVRSKADTAGDREIRLHYEGDDMLVRSIDLPDDTIMRYSYTGGMLTAVSHIRNTELIAAPYVRYTYSSGMLTGIEDALENEYGITYIDGKVARVTDPINERDDISYGSTVTVTHRTSSGAEFGQTEYSLGSDTGKVLWEEDVNGSRTSYEYTQSNELLVKKVKTKTGWEEVSSGGAVSIHSQDNVVETEYTYNGNEDVICEESSDGTSTVTTYDEDGNVAREKEYSEDILTSDTEYEYDEYGNETEAEEHVADTLELTEYDDEGNEIEEEEQEEGITTDITSSEYDDYGNAVETTSVSGDVETEERNTYDAMGRVLKEVTEDAVTEYTYDVFGRVIRTDISRDGHTFHTYTLYNENGEVVSETDERGNVTTYSYDDSGRRISTNSPGTGISRTVYGYAQDITIKDGISGKTHPLLQTETEKDADNNVVSVRYMDKGGEVVREKTGSTYIDHTYDASGNDIADVIWSDGTQDQIMSLSLFNEKGQRFKEVRKPEISDGSYLIGDDSVVTTTTFTDTGDTYTEEDALGNIKRYEYDEQGRVTDIYKGTGQDLSHDMAVSYSITDSGQETLMTDGNGNMRREIESHAGLTVLSEDLGQDGERIKISSEYDEKGNNIADTYLDGSRVTYSYDACNRMTGKTCIDASGNTESNTSYTYTQYGETDTVSFTPSQGTPVVTEYEYDILGRAVKETSTYGNDPSAVTEYVYDSKGRVGTVKYPDQASIPGLTYEYDAIGRVIRIKTYQSNDTVREYSYGPFNRVSYIKDYVVGTGSCLKTFYSYDDLGSFVSKTVKKNDTDTVVERYDVSYDKADRITELTRVLNNGDGSIDETRYYSYDDHGRLIRTGVLDNLDEPDDDQEPEDLIQYTEYEYDAAGNRVQMTDDSGTTTFTYNGLDQLVYQDAPEKEVEFSYDLRGNMIEENNITDDVVRHSEWSVTGQLLKVSDEDKGGTTVIQQNGYDDDGTRIQKTEGSAVRKYYYVGTDMAVTTEGTNTVFTGIYNGGDIIGAYLGNTPEYELYCTDMQGSTSALIDDSLDVSGGYRYSDYGEVTSFEGTPLENEVCYTGAVYDGATGEHYLRARYYDPETAVFTAQDTLKGGALDESLWNSYGYCNGDPVNHVDTGGHYYYVYLLAYHPAGLIIIGSVIIIGGVYYLAAVHTKNARPSTWNKHTKRRAGRKSVKARKNNKWKDKSNKRK